MAETLAFMSTDTEEGQTSDSDSEELDTFPSDRFEPRGDSEAKGKFSWLSKLKFGQKRDKYRPLSVQSGDIVHVGACASATGQPAAAVQAPHSTDDDEAETEKAVKAKGGLYAMSFPYVLMVVKVLFFHEKFSLVPLALLTLHVVLTVAFVLFAVFLYPPSLNLSVKAFTIPNHPSQIHWDAYNAAKEGKIWNGSVANEDNSDFVYQPQKQSSNNILKRNIIEGCERDPNVQYQIYLHIYWTLDLVFRVPKGNRDRNILTEERIRQIHDIEEHIYDLPDYKDFCHKSKGKDFCDPINSLLTWLYPRNRDDGSFVYNPDHFTPNLAESLRQLKDNYTNALWFTAGQVTVINSTTFVADLLRSQVRIGLPLPCYTYTRNRVKDRYNEESDLVTKFFVSLIPYLESASNSEVEVLYGGPNVYEYEVQDASRHDIYLAIISFAFVLVLTVVMSGFSLWLGLMAIYAIASSFPIAFCIYTNVFGINTVGLLNLISLFVIIGIGVDDILVFINTFKQSARLSGLNTVHKRITHTIIEASKATFFTSITTSVAFFANAISSIPAVYQFGVFMGLIVMLCYVQVVLVVPFILHIWQSYFRIAENFVYSPLGRLCRKRKVDVTNLPAVKMTNRSTEDGDSGIEIMTGGNGSSEPSDNSSTASSSSVSDTNVLIQEPEMENGNGIHDVNPDRGVDGFIERIEVEDSILYTTPQDRIEVTISEETGTDDLSLATPVTTDDDVIIGKSSAESRWTELQQIGMMRFVARPVMIFFLIGSKSPKRNARLCGLTMVFIFIGIMALSCLSTAFLKPTDRPPQFFKPSSNIQKMLDLSGNLTDTATLNCYSCSAWYSNGAIPTVKPPSNPTPTRPSVPPPSSPPSHHTRPPQPTEPIVDRTTPAPPATHHESRVTTPERTQTPPPITHQQLPPTTKSHPPDVTDHNIPDVTTVAPHTASSSHITDAPPTHAGPATNETIVGNQFSNNAIVYVVFGIDGVHRKYDASHVIPEEGEGDFARLDSKFNSTFTCPRKPGADSVIAGTIRAMCRLCLNISNPDNRLVLKDNFQCFPSKLLSEFGCLMTLAQSVTECKPFLTTRYSSKVTVSAEVGVYRNRTDGSKSLQYLAMAFRSTSNPGENPFRSMLEYQRWEDFLSKEIREISENKVLYGEEVGELLASTFQTGEYWVQINIELVAVYGSIYGILISFSLCSLVVAVLSHNWRIVLSMFLTIMGILFTLLGIFRMLGWTLGIVEAVSLSILVGNALDYCIHLSEGYVAVDGRHLAFVERFKFAAGASIRVKKVMASISFIGVSIISSAITTVVAIVPLMGTWIQLFTRFGSILLIETLVAIIYTLVFCSTFLGLFGPLKTNVQNRVINAVCTICGTIGFYLVGLMVLFIATQAGVVIPGPDGRPLFS